MVEHSGSIMNSLHSLVNTAGYGLEVAPYYQPCLLKVDYNVTYTDYMDNAAIQAKALENPELNCSDIPLVDFVWQPGVPLLQCLPKANKFDYVIASHVMEHVANPLGWITELLSTVDIGGRIALFLPDKRFSSDYLRKESCFPQLLQWWIEQPIAPTIGQVVDFMSNVLSLNHDTSVNWNSKDSVLELPLHYSFEEVVNTGIAIFNDQPYVDVHCTVWTAKSFEETFRQVDKSGIIGARLLHVIEDEGEFLAILEKVTEPRFKPPAPKLASAGVVNNQQLTFESIDHQLGILRHDLTHLIQKTHEATGATYRIEDTVRTLTSLKNKPR